MPFARDQTVNVEQSFSKRKDVTNEAFGHFFSL